MNYLPQTAIVERLIIAVNQLLPKLPNDVLKSSLVGALSEFEKAITPSTIHLEEVFQHAALQQISIDQIQAISILQNAALDINYNYAAGAVEYYVDGYIQTVKGDYEFK